MARLKMVYIEWADAHAVLDTWTHPDDIEDDGEYINQTCAFVVPDVKKDHVTLCQSVTPDGDIDHVIHVLQQNIRKFVVLDFPAQQGH